MKMRFSVTRLTVAVLIVAFLIGNQPAAAQPAASDGATTRPAEPTSQPASAPAAKKAEAPAFFRLDYSGDFLHSPAMTGDWGGERTKLAEKGISFNVETLQYGQGNAHGGKSTNDTFRYGGSSDYTLQLDTGRMGLWPGGYIKVRGETRWGEGVDKFAGAVAPPNFDSLFPSPEPNGVTTLTEYYLMQFLSEKFGIIAGQVDMTRLPGQNVLFSDPYGQFMNTAFLGNFAAFAVAPIAGMTVGALYMPTKWLSGATLVVDSYGTSKFSGFESACHSPQDVGIIQNLTFNIKPFDLDGHQRFNFGYSTREHIEMNQLGRLALSGAVGPSFDRMNIPKLRPGGRNQRPQDVIPRAILSKAIEPHPTNSENWAFWYDFDQYFYQCPNDRTQGLGLFGSFGMTPGELFPISEFYTIGLGGKGVISHRPRDRYGVGYYYINFSNEIPGLLDLNAEQGAELFYNIEVTPWLHITPDLQVITNPGGGQDRDVAIVYGIRAQVSF